MTPYAILRCMIPSCNISFMCEMLEEEYNACCPACGESEELYYIGEMMLDLMEVDDE